MDLTTIGWAITAVFVSMIVYALWIGIALFNRSAEPDEARERGADNG